MGPEASAVVYRYCRRCSFVTMDGDYTGLLAMEGHDLDERTVTSREVV